MTSKEEIKEVENVVKIFFIEERVINLASSIGRKKIIEKIYTEPLKNLSNDVNNKDLQLLTVRGLN